MFNKKKMTTTSFLCQTKQKSNFSNNYYVKKTQKKNVYENFTKNYFKNKKNSNYQSIRLRN